VCVVGGGGGGEGGGGVGEKGAREEGATKWLDVRYSERLACYDFGLTLAVQLATTGVVSCGHTDIWTRLLPLCMLSESVQVLAGGLISSSFCEC